MASIKKSVMFSDSTVNYIKARYRHEDEIQWSEALNETFKALKFLTSENLPDLTQEEWETILNVYSGCILNQFHLPFRVASDMMDNVGAISLEELDANYAKLVKKVHNFSHIEQFVIMDFTRKFWSTDWSACKTWDEIYSKLITL